jgi:hypothetical protein
MRKLFGMRPKTQPGENYRLAVVASTSAAEAGLCVTTSSDDSGFQVLAEAITDDYHMLRSANGHAGSVVLFDQAGLQVNIGALSEIPLRGLYHTARGNLVVHVSEAQVPLLAPRRATRARIGTAGQKLAWPELPARV